MRVKPFEREGTGKDGITSTPDNPDRMRIQPGQSDALNVPSVSEMLVLK